MRLPSTRGAAGIVAKSLGDMQNILNALREEMAEKSAELERAKAQLVACNFELDKFKDQVAVRETGRLSTEGHYEGTDIFNLVLETDDHA